MLEGKKDLLFKDYHQPKIQLTELEELEEIIGRGKATFIEVGEALARVRDKKLYLEHYRTFEEYYQQRWGFKKSYAYALMDASEEAQKLPEPERPKTEREARKSLKIRRTSAMAEDIPKNKDVSQNEQTDYASALTAAFEQPKKKQKGVQVNLTDTEQEEADLLDEIITRIRRAATNRGFLKALKEWLDDSDI